MKKSLIALSIISSALYSSNSQYFFAGGDITSSKIEFNNSNKDYNKNYVGWKIGYKNNNYRLYTKYDKVYFKNSQNKIFSLNIDYLNSIGNNIDWFTGIGFNRMTLNSNKIDDTDIANRVGLQTGILYEFDNDWSFDLGYKRVYINKSLDDGINRDDIDRIDSIFTGLSYKFGKPKPKPIIKPIVKLVPKKIETKKAPSLDMGDSDNDGIENYRDKCPNSVPNAKVDSNGCIILDMGDDDNDGVKNYQDKCPNTPKDAIIDNFGCIVNIKFRTMFDVDSANLKDDAKLELRDIANIFNSHSNLSAKILGHTDASGSKKYNLKLSQERVESIIKYLIENGADASKLSGEGVGEDFPIASNKTKEGKALNRRVEIEFYQK